MPANINELIQHQNMRDVRVWNCKIWPACRHGQEDRRMLAISFTNTV